MNCCGNKREQFQTQRTPDRPPGPPVRGLRAQAGVPFRVVFEYAGLHPMIVIGPVSGRRYHFDGPGAKVEVDPRDRRSLAVVPRLRQLT